MMRQAVKLAMLREACKFAAVVLLVGMTTMTCLYLVERLDLEPSGSVGP